jgi:7,8-dihydropterin-6-yl-methyl-4-(beta-D-ribofuranosyl)aminobenzene 5'-phosphate synthase
MILETAKGLVVLMGCCHAGLINTLEHVAYTMGRRDVYAIIGGTHLGFCGQEQLEMTIAALKEWRVQKVAASHCTGFAASARLSREMPKEFQMALVGYTLEV